MRKYIAEILGTFVLVLFGTGIAVVSSGDLVATSLAFGLSIVVCAYAIGNISGCHINPAVSLAMYLNKKLTLKEFAFYVISQLIGAIFASSILCIILNNTSIGVDSLGANGYSFLSANNISLLGTIITEVVLTFIFIFTILCVTNDETKTNLSGFVIGLSLTFVHLLGIPLTGTSVNPARSLAPAIFMRGDALKQVWVFIVFPLIGAVLAYLVFRYLYQEEKEEEVKKTNKK